MDRNKKTNLNKTNEKYLLRPGRKTRVDPQEVCCLKLTKTEKETIILFNEEEDAAQVFTYNAKLKKRLKKYAAAYPGVAVMENEDIYGGVTYTLPKQRMSIMLTQPFDQTKRAAYRERARRQMETGNISLVTKHNPDDPEASGTQEEDQPSLRLEHPIHAN